MSCLNEEENAFCPSSDEDLAGEQNNVPVAAAGGVGAAELQSLPEGAGEAAAAAAAAAIRRQPSCESGSPRRRTTLGASAEHDFETAWSTELAGDAAAISDYLDVATLGPPQNSSSPVRLSLGQQLGPRGRADGGESGAGPQQGGTSGRRAQPAAGLASAAAASADMQRDPNPRLDIVELADQTLNLLSFKILTLPEELTVSGVEELAEAPPTSDSKVSGCSRLETKFNTQDPHSMQEIASLADCKFHLEQFDSVKQVKPDIPEPLSLGKMISSSGETLQCRDRLDPTQANRAAAIPKTTHFKLDAGTWDNSEKMKSQGSDRNLPQAAKRSRNTAAKPIPRGTALCTNFISLSAQQNSHSGKDLLTPKTKPAKGQNKDTNSLSSSCQQFEFKLLPVQQGAIAQPEKANRQRQRMKPLRCLPGKDTRNRLHLNHSASRLPTPNGSHMSNHSLRYQKQTIDILSEYSTVNELIPPRRDNIARSSCANKTRIPSPLKGPDGSNLTRSRMQSQQTPLSPGSVTVEQTPTFSDGDTRAHFPASSWSFSGANNHPGIILSDEIPTRDLEFSQQQKQLPKRLNDPKRNTSDIPKDSAQKVSTPLAVENVQLETISSGHQQLTTCRSSELVSIQPRTAEAGTQTVPSIRVSSPRTASTAPPALDTQQHNTGDSAPTTPNRLQGVNMVQRGNRTHRGFYTVPQMFPVPVHPQHTFWPNTCRIPFIYRNPHCYVPGNPRYPFICRLSNAPWIQYRPANGASVNFLHKFQAQPVTFTTPHVFHVAPAEPTWFRLPVVYYTSPADRFWQSLPRAHQHHHHHHHHFQQLQPHPQIELRDNRQATNERVAAWLRQVAVDVGAAASGRVTSPAAASSASVSSQLTAPSAAAERPRHTGESHAPLAQ